MLALYALAAAVAAQTPVMPQPIAADTDQKVHCQREEVTGSLIGYRKVCHTNAEWRRLHEAAQDSAEKMLDQGRICPGCQGR